MNKDHKHYLKLTTTTKNHHFLHALPPLKKHIQPYTHIITNKHTINTTKHLFPPTKPQKLKTYPIVFNTISVHKINPILFHHSTILPTSNTALTT
ncbi:two-component system activity regulator YycH, partial [Staphylococcus aureus]|uniref:two-component system activity regulator YycH n=1 Tax=Staphylococcus aureus TaxID=1280 RepID=UPI0021B34072